MEKILFPDLLEEERGQVVLDNCDSVEILGYTRMFTEQEIIALKDQLSDAALLIEELVAQKKKRDAEIDAIIKAQKARLKSFMDNVRLKSVFVKEECYVYRDEANLKIGYYNNKGELVQERAMRADEMQRTIQFRKLESSF